MKFLYHTAVLLILLTLVSSSDSNYKLTDIIYKYQLNQFVYKNDKSKHILESLNFLNASIPQEKIKDTFWLINAFDYKLNIYEALLLSKSDTINLVLEKDSTINIYKSIEAYDGYSDIIDSLNLNKRLPLYSASLMTLNMKIYKDSKGNIKINGFNLDNINSIIEKFKIK